MTSVAQAWELNRFRKVRLAKGKQKIVYVSAPDVEANRADGKNRYVVVVRAFGQGASGETEKHFCRHVEILGPCVVCHTPEEPLPGTGGRAVAVMRTTASVLMYFDRDESGLPAQAGVTSAPHRSHIPGC